MRVFGIIFLCLWFAAIALAVSIHTPGRHRMMQVAAAPQNLMYFGLAANTTNTPPSITAATLTNFTSDVTWTSPLGTTTNTKTPPYSFFTNAGLYSLAVRDWSKVTTCTFEQAASRRFLTNIINDIASPYMTALSSMANCFKRNTGNVDFVSFTFPAAVVNLSGAFFGVTGQNTIWPSFSSLINANTLASTFQNATTVAYGLPSVDSMTNVTTLESTWNSSTAYTGVFPVVSSLSKVTTLASTWLGCSAQEIAFPVVSNLLSVSTLADCWRNCSGMTGMFPVVSTLTNVSTLETAWLGCSGQKTVFPDVSSMTKLTTIRAAWINCSGMTGVFCDVSGLTNLTTCSEAWSGCRLTPVQPISDNVLLTKVTTFHDTFATCTNMSGTISNWTWRTIITDFDSYKSKIGYSSGVPGPLATNVKTNGFTIRMDDSTMPQEQVSQLLIDLDTSATSNGTVNVGGTTVGVSNATPNVAGWQSVTNLRAKGWTVTCN